MTWIGKGEDKGIEPRILLHDSKKDYGDSNTSNMLIHGDNLLALKALESDFTGKIKCIYIDPPFNTGAAFEYYDDNLEHSIWLDLMYERLIHLRNLLTTDGGVILVHIDDVEMAYLKVIMDEVFGRSNFVCSIAVKSNNLSGNKTAHKDKTILKNKEFILVYKRGGSLKVNPQYTVKNKWDTHYTHFIYEDESRIVDRPLKDVLKEEGIIGPKDRVTESSINDPTFKNFVLKNSHKIFRPVNSIDETQRKRSKEHPGEIITWEKDGKYYMALNGSRLSPLSSSVKTINGKEEFAQLLGDLWDDIDFQNTQNEGYGSFPASKKPEALIRRILDMFTVEGDYVLDSFLGSGTTAAVAHKMNRKWIGIELNNHCYTHCKPRIDKVIDGKDDRGITRYVGWTGGGGYKFYELAPSLIKEDANGFHVISEEYNPEMLSAAVAKMNGYKYSPDPECFWKSGVSFPGNYIFVTTKFVTYELVDQIAQDIKNNESLLICASAFDNNLDQRYENISVKKIPLSLLERCRFNVGNYNLNLKSEECSNE